MEGSSTPWANSGMGGPTESWTLNTSESVGCTHIDEAGQPCRNAVGGSLSSLAEVLEDGPLPQRFYLSAKACAGILRRAGKRGKALPPMLEQALMRVAYSELSEPSVPTPTPEPTQDRMPTPGRTPTPGD